MHSRKNPVSETCSASLEFFFVLNKRCAVVVWAWCQADLDAVARAAAGSRGDEEVFLSKYFLRFCYGLKNRSRKAPESYRKNFQPVQECFRKFFSKMFTQTLKNRSRKAPDNTFQRFYARSPKNPFGFTKLFLKFSASY